MIVVLTTMPDFKSAHKLAGEIVQKKLAACVSIIQNINSIYQWKGKVEKTRECLVVIKAPKTQWKALEKFVLSRHLYELPELIALPVTRVSKKYLSWIYRAL